MRPPLLLYAALALAGCATLPPAQYPQRGPWAEKDLGLPPSGPDRIVAALASPCNDSLYVTLRARPLDSMSEREYAYFMEKERQCAAWKESPALKKEDDSGQTNWGVVGIVLTVLLAMGFVSAAAN